MRSSMKKAYGKIGLWLMVIALTCTFVSIPVLSSAAIPVVSSATTMMTITVTNNSGRDIYHLYLSPVDRDAWGPDQINETILKTGEAFNINDVSCASNEIKVIAEDKEGCFFYGVVSCAQASTGWTITADTPRDCGN